MTNPYPEEFVGAWAETVLATPQGFDLWHRQVESYRVAWQLDAALRLIREAKRLNLAEPAYSMVLQNEAMLYTQTGDWPRAVKTLIRAIDRLENTPYVVEGIGLLLDLGMILRLQGNIAGAEAAHEQALELAEQIENESFRAEALSQMGLTELHQEKFAAAIDHFEQALVILEQTDAVADMARVLNHLGDSYRRMEQLGKAQERLEIALQLIPDDEENSHLKAQITSNLGSVMFEQGDLIQAERLWSTALARIESIGAIFDKIGLLNNLGGLAFEKERYADALTLFQESLALADELGDDRGRKEAVANLALTLKVSGNEQASNA